MKTWEARPKYSFIYNVCSSATFPSSGRRREGREGRGKERRGVRKGKKHEQRGGRRKKRENQGSKEIGKERKQNRINGGKLELKVEIEDVKKNERRARHRCTKKGINGRKGRDRREKRER